MEGAATVLEVPMPWLAGLRQEVIAVGGAATASDGFYVSLVGENLAGFALAPPGMAAQEAAKSLYAGVLAQLDGRSLYRVWNYVPQINHEVQGVENYRAFNAGRHEAFNAAFGPHFDHQLPAASALGIPGDRMALCFLAGPAAARHLENPEQVPAFKYPAAYGPTPPSFARGTVVTHPGGQAWYLSGTASIKGHASLGTTIEEQAALTFDNVRLMFDRMELPAHAAGSWKIFLRHRRDLPACQVAFAAAFPEAQADAMFLEADICRRALLLEVEATFQQPVFSHEVIAYQNSSVINA